MFHTVPVKLDFSRIYLRSDLFKLLMNNFVDAKLLN